MHNWKRYAELVGGVQRFQKTFFRNSDGVLNLNELVMNIQNKHRIMIRNDPVNKSNKTWE